MNQEIRTYVVTGAAGGIGGATAKRLLRTGANVLGVDISQRRLDGPQRHRAGIRRLQLPAPGRHGFDKPAQMTQFRQRANVIPAPSPAAYDTNPLRHDPFNRRRAMPP